MAGPIKPSEVQTKKNESLPEEVFKAFNDLIVEKWDGREAKIMQDEAVSRIVYALGIERHDVFTRKLLDVEDAFRKAGWSVEFDKPGYCESYSAFYVFRKKK